MKLCPIAMVTALEEMMSNPAIEKKIRDSVPLVKKKRYKNNEVEPRLKRTVLL